MTYDNKLATSQPKPLPGLGSFGSDSREVLWERRRGSFFWKEVQDEVQDITGVVTPDDFKKSSQERKYKKYSTTHRVIRGSRR